MWDKLFVGGVLLVLICGAITLNILETRICRLEHKNELLEHKNELLEIKISNVEEWIKHLESTDPD